MRFKLYAVVSEEGAIVGRYLHDSVLHKGKTLAVNQRTVESFWGGELISRYNNARLSSAKGFIDLLTHQEPIFHSEGGILIHHN